MFGSETLNFEEWTKLVFQLIFIFKAITCCDGFFISKTYYLLKINFIQKNTLKIDVF